MDRFKQEMSRRVGVGGLKCWCCNWTHGAWSASKARLRRTARRVLKQEDKNETRSEV